MLRGTLSGKSTMKMVMCIEIAMHLLLLVKLVCIASLHAACNLKLRFGKATLSQWISVQCLSVQTPDGWMIIIV